MHRTNGNGLPE